ncbi:hypothetical protein BJX66DRAFT_119535 [Aspergillus keveii]|uniref:Uncharacterized protein n=1 Tax=Aspergillus keveii TaxID=714993 RepID=A0ABR4FK37_9EURO
MALMKLTQFSVEAVAEGALLYARNPVSEKQIARANIGLEYLNDHDTNGDRFPGDRVEPGIGWVYVQVRTSDRSGSHFSCSLLQGGEVKKFHVEFLKTVYNPMDNPRRENRVISTNVYATTPDFEQGWIKSDHDITWPCPVTYPLNGVRHAIQYLGKAEAFIPHERLFPRDSSKEKVQARFLCSIRPKSQLLRLEFFLAEGAKNSTYRLEETFVPGALWSDESEARSQSFGFRPSPHMSLWAPGSKPGRKGNPRPPRRSIWDDPNDVLPFNRKRPADLPKKPAKVRRPLLRYSRKSVDSPVSAELRRTQMSIASIVEGIMLHKTQLRKLKLTLNRRASLAAININTTTHF